MFAPPADIATRVFARLPESHLSGRPDNEWVRGQPAGSSLRSVIEGPSFDREGNLWCVDIPNGRVFRIAPDARLDLVTEYDGWPNGLKIHRDGRIFIADYKHGIVVLDPASGRVLPYLERANLERFKAVNDLFFARNGDLYFTDQGLTGLHDPTGRVYRVTSAGRVDCLLDNVPSPNGLVMNHDETTLFVAVTRGNCVWRVPLMPDGSVSKVGIFIQLSGGMGPDGLALDDAGNLVVAHTGLGSVWVFDAQGEPLYRIRSCEGRHTTNVAYGGPDNRTLYITESATGTILCADLPTAGKLMYSHQAAD
ncbi:MAG: SMP-30/gluconolactonase/LRE family protein [Casimicrobiaceae bacterium]